MSPRPILIIHADADRRQALRALLAEREVLEAANRAQALPLLSRGDLSLVLSQALEFRRLLRELERRAPGTPRAVLCPDDAEALHQLSELASEGYDFSTVSETSPEALRALLEPRGSVRVSPARRLTARFQVGGVPFAAEVVELGNDGLGVALEAHAPVELLAPGLRVERASVGDERGEVLSPRTWVVRTVRGDAGGVRRVGFTIEPRSPEVEARQPVRLRDEVRIRGLLRRAVKRQALFDVRLADDSRHRHFTQCTLDPAGRLVLSAPRPGSVFQAGEIALVSFELLGTQVEGVTAILEASPGRLLLAAPRSAQQRDRREALRVQLAEAAPGQVHFTSPLTGAQLTGRVVDLHPTGLSFEVDGERQPLPPGLRLPDVSLHLGGARAGCAAEVQTSRLISGRQRVGLRLFCAPGPARQVLLRAWLAQLVPEVSCGGQLDFTNIWSLFQHERVNFPDHPLEAPRTLEVLGHAHRALGDGSHGLGKTFVFTDGGTVRGHASGLRTHSRTWLSQHLAVRSGYHRQTHVSQTLVNLSFDYAEALGDVDYLRGLWRVSNRWTSRVYGAATSRLVRPGLSFVTSFTPMRVAVDAPLLTPRGLAELELAEARAGFGHRSSRAESRDGSLGSPGYPVGGPSTPLGVNGSGGAWGGEGSRPARASTVEERRLLVQHLRRTWDPLRLRADDLVEGELELESLSARYRALGLERSRHVGVVEGPDGPRGWVLVERMSQGLFWAEWYDAFRLVLVAPDAPDAAQVRLALAAYALADARARGRSHSHCLAADADVPVLEQAGFGNLGRVMEFCAHRSMNREMTAQLLAIFERLARRERSAAAEEGDDA